MPVFPYENKEIYYQLHGQEDGAVITFINGLTQRVEQWKQYCEYFTERGYRVLLFDLMGQGQSEKPTLFINFRDNQVVLRALLDHLGIDELHVCGISFGGMVALRFAFEFPECTRSLVAMSTISERDEHYEAIVNNVYEGMVSVGFEYLVRQFIPFNFSPKWMKEFRHLIPRTVRDSFNHNDLYAIQNLMESLKNFDSFTHELKNITCPTMILNGEHDYLTPRWCHDKLRLEIKNSRLVLMQHVYHAFVIEIPLIVCRVIEDFILKVESGESIGDQSVWIAEDDPNSERLMFPCEGDHRRSIPLPVPHAPDAARGGHG